MFPIILQTKYFTIHSLWLFITIALIVGSIVFMKTGTKNGLKMQFITDHTFAILAFSLIGSRLFAIIFNWNKFFYEYSLDTFLQIFKIWDKGLSIWGGVIVGLFSLYKLCKENNQSFLKWIDSIVPAVMIGIAITCVGAFLDGSWYGNETNLPWGVNFESPAIKYTVPIHPTQIYMLLYSLSIGIAILFLRGHKFFEQSGKIGMFGICIGSFILFFQEFVRGDDATMILGTRFTQIASAGVFIFSLTFLIIYYNKKAENLKNRIIGIKKKTF